MSLSSELLTKSVRRNNKYNKIVNLLVHGSTDKEKPNREKKIFNDIKDLVVFTAMIGKRFNETEPLEKENTGIILSTFAGSGSGKYSLTDQHNVLFMLGLVEKKQMEYMKDDHISEILVIFEQYSNGGFKIIEGWLAESGWRSLIILDKIVDEIAKLHSVNINVDANPF